MSQLETVIDAELVWDADYEGTLSTDWDFDTAKAEQERILSFAASFAKDWQEYMIDAYYHRIWRGLGFGGGWDEWRSSITTVKLPSADRKAMAQEASKRGFSTRAIASMQGVSQATASRDLRESNDSPPREPKENEFTCDSCGKIKRLDKRVEWADEVYCEPCATRLEESLEHQEQQPEPEGPDEIAISKMNQVAKLAAKTPWTKASAARIVKLSTEIAKGLSDG